MHTKKENSFLFPASWCRTETPSPCRTLFETRRLPRRLLIAKFHYTGPTGPTRTRTDFFAARVSEKLRWSVRVSDKVGAGPCVSGRVRVVEFSLNHGARRHLRSIYPTSAGLDVVYGLRRQASGLQSRWRRSGRDSWGGRSGWEWERNEPRKLQESWSMHSRVHACTGLHDGMVAQW